MPDGKSILIVDDNLNNVRLLSAVLGHEGYDIRKALNGPMAIQAAKTLVPDLILLDVMMPEMDGYEVCQQLKQDAAIASVPIVFISALTEVFDKVKAFRVGGADYITKPFHFEEVIVRIRHHLALRAAEQKLQQVNLDLEERVKERTQQLEIANAQLLEMALHDNLTGLPNRTMFMQQLAVTLEQIQTHSPDIQPLDHLELGFTVFSLDCDRFKLVNDSLGHTVGDQLLIAVAERLCKLLEPKDILARFGGDEFAILRPRLISPEQASALAQQLIEGLSRAFQLPSCEIFVTASIGIVLGERDYTKPEYVLRDADTAMYRAKAKGKGQFLLFEPAMHQNAMQRLQIETDLRRALDRRELVAYYQPIFQLKTGKLAGFEALVRWIHPVTGLVPPDQFIPIAEETDLVQQLDLQIFEMACCQLRDWQQRDVIDASVTMSVNLSAKQLMQPKLVETIDELLATTKVSPKNLILEITESSLMLNPRASVERLNKLRARKIRTSIDDFGTGYSSLSYLHRLPLDALKIDKSFVQEMSIDQGNNRLIPLIVNIAKTMEISVTAEGIETSEQAQHLKQLSCTLGQGYWFACPMSAAEIEDFLQDNR